MRPHALPPVNEEERIQRAYGVSPKAARAHVEAKDEMQILAQDLLERIRAEMPNANFGELVSAYRAIARFAHEEPAKKLKLDTGEPEKRSKKQMRAEFDALVSLMTDEEFAALGEQRKLAPPTLELEPATGEETQEADVVEREPAE